MFNTWWELRMARHKSGTFPKHKKEPLEDVDPDFDEWSGGGAPGKSKVMCICPGCGKTHVMKMRWIGRGVPRKFCQSCRDRETPLDDLD